MQSTGFDGCSHKVMQTLAVRKLTVNAEWHRECDRMGRGVAGVKCFRRSGDRGFYQIDNGQLTGVCTDQSFRPADRSVEQAAAVVTRHIDTAATNLQKLTNRPKHQVPRVNVELDPVYRSVSIDESKKRGNAYPAHYELSNLSYHYSTNTIAILPASLNALVAFSVHAVARLWKYFFAVMHEYGHAIEYHDVRDGLCKDAYMRDGSIRRGDPAYRAVVAVCRGVREAIADSYGFFLSGETVAELEQMPMYGIARNPFHPFFSKLQEDIRKEMDVHRLRFYLQDERAFRTRGNPVVRSAHFMGSVYAHHWLQAVLAVSNLSQSNSAQEIARWMVPTVSEFTTEFASSLRTGSLGSDPTRRAETYIRVANQSFAKALSRVSNRMGSSPIHPQEVERLALTVLGRGFSGI
jgi:hypothetical protein